MQHLMIAQNTEYSGPKVHGYKTPLDAKPDMRYKTQQSNYSQI